jgi:RNase P subunit RPR2
MSKQSQRDEAERLVREALERKTVAVKHGNTRIEAICGKCGAPNRVTAAPGETRVAYTCKECGDKQRWPERARDLAALEKWCRVPVSF